MLSKEKIKQIRKLHDKKGRNESGLFLVEGRKMILELLQSDWRENIVEIYVSKKLFQEINLGIICYEEDIQKISTLENNHDGVAVVKQKNINGFEILQGWTLVLDGVRDPGNMGTILRTASWFGIEYIICSPDCVEIYNPKLISATMGAIFHVQIISEALEIFFQRNTLPVFGAELSGVDIGELSFPDSGILVMGSESHGISELSQKYIHQKICIPKIGHGESLNVSIATGILLSHITK